MQTLRGTFDIGHEKWSQQMERWSCHTLGKEYFCEGKSRSSVSYSLTLGMPNNIFR